MTHSYNPKPDANSLALRNECSGGLPQGKEGLLLRFGDYMKVELIDCTVDPLFIINHAARTCYNSHNKDKIDKRADFIKGLIKSGHETPLEFASATFDIECSRICQNQMVRHRHASFCVMSERYVDVGEMEFTYPYQLLTEYAGAIEYVQEAKRIYKALIKAGVKREDARFLLPQGIETKLCVNMNFRELRHFLKLRMDDNAQWEIRQIATEIYDICRERWPWLVEDLV